MQVNWIFSLLILAGCEQVTQGIEKSSLRPELLDHIPVMMEAYDVDGLSVSMVAGDTTLLGQARQ